MQIKRRHHIGNTQSQNATGARSHARGGDLPRGGITSNNVGRAGARPYRSGLFLRGFRSVPLPLQIIETTTALFDLVVLLTHAVPVSRTGAMVNQTSMPTNSLFWRCANSKWNWSGFGVGPFTCLRPQ